MLWHITRWLLTKNVFNFCISHEKSVTTHKETNGSHYHFFIEFNTRLYTLFIKWFKDNYNPNLIGRAAGGRPRQYGKVQDIRDELKMLAYTIKDKKYFHTLDKQRIEIAKDIGYAKSEDQVKVIQDRLVKDWSRYHTQFDYDRPEEIHYRQMTRDIIEHFASQDLAVSGFTVKKIIMFWLWNIPAEFAKEELERILTPDIFFSR